MHNDWPAFSLLPATLPTAAAYLYGWVDTTIPGHRTITDGPSVRTLASGYHRGDALAAELTAAGLPCAFANGRFTASPTIPDEMTATDRLAVIMGFLGRAGHLLNTSATHVSAHISPVAIPLHGAMWNQITIDSDDVMQLSRQQRASGYAWGAVRVFDVELTLHRWAFEALSTGWCTRGRVTVVAGDDTPMSGTNPDGYIQGQVLQVSRPEVIDEIEQVYRVLMRIAEVAS